MVRNWTTPTLSLLIVLLGGCTTAQPINSLFAPSFTPAYDFAASGKAMVPVPYTIGIIDMTVNFETVPPNFLTSQLTPATKQAQKDFAKAISNGLEKVILAKGMTVAGPFETYADMTYPERSRCGYLIQPEMTLNITLGEGNGAISPLPEAYSSIYDPGRSLIVARRAVVFRVKPSLDYLILDPLTNQKLERHSLKLEEFDLRYDLLVARVGKDWIPIRRDYPQYLNQTYGFNHLFDRTFTGFMPKLESLVSAEEFQSLEKYKQEIREKKVY